jgi:hypothetical protein
LSIAVGSVKLAGSKISVIESSPAVRTPPDVAGELGSGVVEGDEAAEGATGAVDDGATGTAE